MNVKIDKCKSAFKYRMKGFRSNPVRVQSDHYQVIFVVNKHKFKPHNLNTKSCE